MSRPTITAQLERIADKLDAMDGRARDFERETSIALTKLQGLVDNAVKRTEVLETKVSAQGDEIDKLKIAQARGTKVAAGAGAGAGTLLAALIELLTGSPLL